MARNAGSLETRRVLVVEDEYFLADDLSSLIEGVGATVEGPYTDLLEVGAALRRRSFDVAVLDINVRGEEIYPVAVELRSMAVPFMFVTGYGGSSIPEEWRDIPICAKPYRPGEVISKLASLVG